jgi:hypothetical protein
MGQQLQTSRLRLWRSGHGESAWLSKLIDTMEEVSRPELRGLACDPSILVGLRAQLARPASAYAHCGSNFSLLN